MLTTPEAYAIFWQTRGFTGPASTTRDDMALPKKRHSKARTRRRRKINAKIKLPTLITSPESGEPVKRHHVDMKSGFYRGKQVFEPEELE